MSGERAPSHLRAAIQLALRGLTRGTREEAARGPRRRAAVESRAVVASAAGVRRFSELLARVEGDGAAGGRVPPTYSATWETALALRLLAQSELPFPRGGIVHTGGELVALRPIRVGDALRCRVELERAEPHPRGLQLELKCRTWLPAGQLCQENSTRLLLPGVGAARAREASVGEPESGDQEWRTVTAWRLRGGLGRRYARASGDFNPIHLWRWSARLLGYDRPILQGHCIQALVAAALYGRLWSGDPTALRRLAIQFRRPLSLPARVELQLADRGDAGRFRLVDEGSDRVYAAGEYGGGTP